MPYELLIQDSFSAAHNLREYQGKCERLHGHNWRVDLRLEANHLDNQGMILDFNEGKRILAEALDPVEHAYLHEVAPFVELNH